MLVDVITAALGLLALVDSLSHDVVDLALLQEVKEEGVRQCEVECMLCTSGLSIHDEYRPTSSLHHIQSQYSVRCCRDPP